MERMTVKRLEAIKQPGRHRTDQTLYLIVEPSGSKHWVQRVVVNGRRRDLGLGSYPLTSLSEARERAYQNRRLARQGQDPMPRAAKVPSFRVAAERTLQANRAKWRGGKTAANWTASMERYAYPAIGDRRIDQIDRRDVVGILRGIWSNKPAMARKLKTRLRLVFAWAVAHDLRETNPCDGIDGALPSMPAVKAHHRALDYRAVGAALRAVDESNASPVVKAAIRFLTLTACRSGEVRMATWGEIDLKAREWRIPASRTKTGVEHRVPLSDAAVEVLRRVEPLRDSSDLAFPSPVRAGRSMSDMTLSKSLKLARVDCVPHGLRATFRTWASEQTSTPHAVCERALGHAVGSAVERSYARSDLFEKRAKLMAEWGQFVGCA